MPERDPELEDLFTHPAELEVVRLLKASRPATPPLDPHFRSYLRGRLLTEARRTLPAAPPRAWFRLGALTGQLRGSFYGLTPLRALAVAATAFLVVLGYEAYAHRPAGAPETAVRVTSSLNDQTNVAAAEIRLNFSGPVDRTAVEESITIQPATRYTTHWEGQTLVVTPLHELAANTTYSVALRPAPAPTPRASSSTIVAATPAPTATPVVVRFVTAPSPPPPVAPPSFASANLTFLGDSRLADAGTFGTAAWAADGKIVATRPGARATPNASASASPTAAASPSGAPASPQVADLWLMSPRGSFIRKVASNVIDPAVAPDSVKVAFWRPADGGGYALMETITSASGDEATQLAVVPGPPTAPPVWLGVDHVGYTDAGSFHLVDLQGNSALTATIPVSGAAAGSRDGRRLAAQTPNGAAVYDLATARPLSLPAAAVGFSWSPRGDLAFVIQQTQGSELWVLGPGASLPRKIASSQPGESWSMVNWSPDASSLLFASRSTTPDAGTTSHAFLIDASGGAPRQFGSLDYEAIDWSPDGKQVLFTRRDETGQAALWAATVKVGALSDLDRAQQDAVAVVKTFMDARLRKDAAAADGQLGPAALSTYESGGSTLLSPAGGVRFERWYPVTVQLVNADAFLVGVRVVEARGNLETGFFEENLTVSRHDQRFLIDAVQSGPLVSLAQGGPSVVAVEVRRDPPGHQVLVHFDSDLAVATVNPMTILIQDSTGAPQKVDGVSYDQETHLATVKVKLSPGTYQLVVTTDLEDYNGKPLGQEYTSPIVITAG